MNKKQYEELRDGIKELNTNIEYLRFDLGRKIACSHSNKLVRRYDILKSEPEAYEWYCPDCDSKLGKASKVQFLEFRISKAYRARADIDDQLLQAKKRLEKFEEYKEK